MSHQVWNCCILMMLVSDLEKMLSNGITSEYLPLTICSRPCSNTNWPLGVLISKIQLEYMPMLFLLKIFFLLSWDLAQCSPSVSSEVVIDDLSG